jgi:hypothetical protein
MVLESGEEEERLSADVKDPTCDRLGNHFEPVLWAIPSYN